MKKLVMAVLSMLLIALLSVSMVACGGEAKVKIIEIDLSHEEYGIAIKKGDTETKAAIDAVLEDLTGDGIEIDGKTVTFDSLYQAEMNAADEDELISIGTVKTESTNRENELVVVTNAEFPPFEYFVGNDFGGIDMQVAKILAKAMDKDLVIIHTAFETVLENVKSGDADICIAGLTINSDRLEEVDFSIPYYTTTQRLAVKADSDLFDGCETEEDVVDKLNSFTDKKAGAAKAQTGYYYMTGNDSFGFDGYANIETKQYTSIALAVQDLANGTVDFVCGDKDTLAAAVKGVNR